MVFNSKFEIGDIVFFIKGNKIASGVIERIDMSHYPSMVWKGPSFQYYFEGNQERIMEKHCFISKAALVSSLLGEGGESEQ